MGPMTILEPQDKRNQKKYIYTRIALDYHKNRLIRYIAGNGISD